MFQIKFAEFQERNKMVIGIFWSTQIFKKYIETSKQKIHNFCLKHFLFELIIIAVFSC